MSSNGEADKSLAIVRGPRYQPIHPVIWINDRGSIIAKDSDESVGQAPVTILLAFR